jgi:hypothetical protein
MRYERRRLGSNDLCWKRYRTAGSVIEQSAEKSVTRSGVSVIATSGGDLQGSVASEAQGGRWLLGGGEAPRRRLSNGSKGA